MHLLTATGCRSWTDFAAFLGCIAIVAGMGWAMCWPASWN